MESFSNETISTDLLYPLSEEPHTILSLIIMGFTLLLGVPGNALVLWVMGLKMKQTANTVWFLNLTVADFVCCLSLPFSMAHLILRGYWPYGWLLCKLIPSIIILNMFASVFLLTAISLDRCLLVIKPIWCQNHRNVRTSYLLCGCIWVVALTMCVPVFVYRETSTVDNYDVCGYNFGIHSSLDYSDSIYDPLEDRFLDNFTAQLPGKMDDKFNSSSFQTNDHLWRTTSTGPHAQTSPVVSPGLPRGLPEFPSEDRRTDFLKNSSVLPSTDSPSAASTFLYIDEFYYYYQSGNFSQYSYYDLVPTPLVAITITRLAVGFLLPFTIIVACYTLIICQMQQRRTSKSRGKTLHVATMVVVVFLVCWTPYHIFGVLHLFTDPETPVGGALVSWDHVVLALASANSCFNPFLYAFLGKDFRTKAKQSMQGILEAAFNEELTHSTSCHQNKISLEKSSVNTTV
ncbi:C3a anaphylatoxin chemotactic receptor [Echinops telfairi]|uniref:C3a anaphylatoxin chemotactic receptor n=2 Tax=Echinops telfairi TaxID=9371 RepID=A0AC55DJM8_ECHTE|nr:C3a anaphylatoxin chemotactic receptor [Echinops telfairi]XP_045151948.1 C3a anaphylatoxin chemotactic receptor [Echinops telfairi]